MLINRISAVQETCHLTMAGDPLMLNPISPSVSTLAPSIRPSIGQLKFCRAPSNCIFTFGAEVRISLVKTLHVPVICLEFFFARLNRRRSERRNCCLDGILIIK